MSCSIGSYRSLGPKMAHPRPWMDSNSRVLAQQTTPHSPDPGCGLCICTPYTRTTASCHPVGLSHILEARKIWDYDNLAQLKLHSWDSLSCMLPGSRWPQEKCAQGWRSRNKAQAIPCRRSLRGARQCCSSHTRSQMRAHLAGVGKHLA